MSANSLNNSEKGRVRRPAVGAYFRALKWPAWVLVGFFTATLLVELIVEVLPFLHISLGSLNPAIIETTLAVLIYAFSLALTIGVPRYLNKDHTSKNDLGLQRLLSWKDIAMAPVGFVVYFVLTILFISAVTFLLPHFNADQAQEIGFGNLTQPFELTLAFITLVLLAPLAEETLFRGYLLGKLRKTLPFFAAALMTSLLFGLLHVSNGSWNVGLDVFALSLVLCYLRESTGSIWTGILIHMMKNGIAYYFLFIKPILSHTIGG